MNAVDDLVAGPGDSKTIGILLCASKNESVVRYALRGTDTPMGVAGYDLLPPAVRAELPAAEELEAALAEPVMVHGEQLTIADAIAKLRTEDPQA